MSLRVAHRPCLRCRRSLRVTARVPPRMETSRATSAARSSRRRMRPRPPHRHHSRPPTEKKSRRVKADGNASGSLLGDASVEAGRQAGRRHDVLSAARFASPVEASANANGECGWRCVGEHAARITPQAADVARKAGADRGIRPPLFIALRGASGRAAGDADAAARPCSRIRSCPCRACVKRSASRGILACTSSSDSWPSLLSRPP